MDLGFRHTDFDTMIAGLMSTEMGLLAIIAAEAPDALTPYVKDFLDNYEDKMGPQYAVLEELLLQYNRQCRRRFSCKAPGLS